MLSLRPKMEAGDRVLRSPEMMEIRGHVGLDPPTDGNDRMDA